MIQEYQYMEISELTLIHEKEKSRFLLGAFSQFINNYHNPIYPRQNNFIVMRKSDFDELQKQALLISGEKK